MVERKSAPEPERLPFVPLYKQYDPRWKDINFDDPKWTEKFGTTIESAGCGPTALAMVLSYHTGRHLFVPEVAKKVVDNGWRALSWDEKEQKLLPDGTHWDAMIGIPELNALKSKTAPWEEVQEALRKGKPVIQSQGPGKIGADGKGDGYFTSFGHFIVLTGVEGDIYKINDPGPRDITHATEAQIIRDLKQSWIIEKP